VFRIGGNTFYNRKNKILMKILEFKRSRIGLIMEFCGIPNGFPNQAFNKASRIIGSYQLMRSRCFCSSRIESGVVFLR
jgi:hypothetical protein